MRKSDIYVSPTYADPFNNTILEAMACKLPVITSNISSIPEMIKHQKSGLLLNVSNCKKEDIIDNLRSSLLSLIDNRNLRTNIGKEAFKTAKEKFSIQKRKKQLEAIYAESLK